MKVCRGFTLLELMVTIAVVAVLATVGIPGYQTMVRNNQLVTQTNELVTALTLARTEAVKRGRNVRLEVQPQARGWIATVAVADTNPLEVIRVVDRQESSVGLLGLTSSEVLLFTPTGTPASTFIFNMQPKSGCSGQQRRTVALGASGQITTTKQPCT